ncbi:hypothetical protein EYF80_014780 [Liparis tanakae]|uniref:Uncharacterized protein n=1 Tax=Liparis tanakae TaxID=230148 RepID=A0A4Z2ICF2_9TELE|nr:hypothetical protein EYF80_014780 [Liparis tanakae]
MPRHLARLSQSVGGTQTAAVVFLYDGLLCAGRGSDNKAVCCSVVRFIAVLSPLLLPCGGRGGDERRTEEADTKEASWKKKKKKKREEEEEEKKSRICGYLGLLKEALEKLVADVPGCPGLLPWSSCQRSTQRRRAFMKKLLTVLSSRPSCWEMVICISLDGRLFSLKMAMRVRRCRSVKTRRCFLGAVLRLGVDGSGGRDGDESGRQRGEREHKAR